MESHRRFLIETLRLRATSLRSMSCNCGSHKCDMPKSFIVVSCRKMLRRLSVHLSSQNFTVLNIRFICRFSHSIVCIINETRKSKSAHELLLMSLQVLFLFLSRFVNLRQTQNLGFPVDNAWALFMFIAHSVE